MKLNPNKAAGVDSIPARLLKCVLANPVSWLFNLSFTRAIVPQLWKQANIFPIYKDGDTGSVANYRGISLLSVVGKCQERILHTAIYDQVSQYLHDSHHGVLRGRSTFSQLVLVHDDWAKVLDNQGQVDVVFRDFSKAFDLVNHALLIRKLNQYGVGSCPPDTEVESIRCGGGGGGATS